MRFSSAPIELQKLGVLEYQEARDDAIQKFRNKAAEGVEDAVREFITPNLTGDTAIDAEFQKAVETELEPLRELKEKLPPFGTIDGSL